MGINHSFLLATLLAVSFTAFAQDGSVNISSPQDGAVLNAKDVNKVVYEIMPGENGDHFHIYIDGKEDVVRNLKGEYTLPALDPGKHVIAIKVVNKNHTPIGIEKSINVMAE